MTLEPVHLGTDQSLDVEQLAHTDSCWPASKEPTLITVMLDQSGSNGNRPALSCFAVDWMRSISVPTSVLTLVHIAYVC